MKANRRNLSAVFALALLAAGVGLGAAAQQFQAQPAPSSSAADQGLKSPYTPQQLERLLENITAKWQTHDGLSANLQWEVRLFGQTLRGAGEYAQVAQGANQRHGLRLYALEPTLPLSVQQAVLGPNRVLWTQWRTTLDEAASTVRLNDVATAGQGITSDGGLNTQMPLVGIAHLVWRLNHGYQFDTAGYVAYRGQSGLLVRGESRLTTAPPLLPFLDENVRGVSLVLNTETGFPLRIQWEKIDDNRARQVVVAVDFQDVRFEADRHSPLLQPKKVVPGAKDETQRYIEAIISVGRQNELVVSRGVPDIR